MTNFNARSDNKGWVSLLRSQKSASSSSKLYIRIFIWSYSLRFLIWVWIWIGLFCCFIFFFITRFFRWYIRGLFTNKIIINNFTGLEVITLTSFRFLHTFTTTRNKDRKETFGKEEFMSIHFEIMKITTLIFKSLKLIFKSRQWIS